MKFVEEQLLCAFRETPAETDCSVSTAVLRMIGQHSSSDQQGWLAEKRAPLQGKAWHLNGDRWEYTANPDQSIQVPASFALSAHLPATPPKKVYAGTSSQAPLIVVAPVVPLKRRK